MTGKQQTRGWDARRELTEMFQEMGVQYSDDSDEVPLAHAAFSMEGEKDDRSFTMAIIAPKYAADELWVACTMRLPRRWSRSDRAVLSQALPAISARVFSQTGSSAAPSPIVRALALRGIVGHYDWVPELEAVQASLHVPVFNLDSSDLDWILDSAFRLADKLARVLQGAKSRGGASLLAAFPVE